LPETAKKRVPLTKERVLRAAIAVADERGVEGLSMRKLATELGVEAMSLYHHVAGKEALLDAMVDAVFGELHLPFVGGDWREATSNIRDDLEPVSASAAPRALFPHERHAHESSAAPVSLMQRRRRAAG